jgi:hypothetical protein
MVWLTVDSLNGKLVLWINQSSLSAITWSSNYIGDNTSDKLNSKILLPGFIDVIVLNKFRDISFK